ncbi:LysR family transcriptional regulator [Wenyingzhuangia marina]|uniref:LysR family transcriptional regulator, regulator for metE and metH n=1 Tax=Wenyingzhuangia marina TaxID=1195760 RepID=A0A1M5U0H6_9FLAO|nr:LysR family transcriptional regulator [Wenyingzhuangia marina]GGF70162.1 XRE family transcriptional regulator [Wenyingzhuangia marina]SHH56527.1 LysR family transcriptional regulator, regulator for metE and metH [Wenyingzhuangia marina]
METKYFRLIKTIVEEGNLANATEKLFLTQSALSHQLKELELQLGFKVFFRKRNQWELTEEGTELYHLGNTVLSSIEKGLNDIKKIQAGSTGTIKVSTECYSFYHGLPGFIQRMGVLYPEIQVDLNLEATHHPIQKILSNEIDIAIVTLKPEDNSLFCIPFFEDEILAIMHKEHPLNKLKKIMAKDFYQEHLIIHSYPLETVSVYQQWLKPNNVMPLKISAVPLTQVALEMIEANIGITCMPLWALKLFKIPENIVFKKVGNKGLKRTHYLVVRKADKNKKYINDFILNFKEQFSVM